MSDRPRLQITQRSTPGPQVALTAGTPAFGGPMASAGAAGAVPTAPAGTPSAPLQTIAFPPPPGASAAPGMAAAEPATTGRDPSAAAAAPVPLEDQIDAIYEAVVERLRRDMLIERERMGDLVGDLLR